MTDPIEFRDLSPSCHPLSSEDEVWLAKVQADVDLTPLILRVGRAPEDAEPIVSRDQAGRWRAGRYIGHLSIGGRRLVIRPRLGLTVVERWLDQALNLITPPKSARRHESESFIARLLARVWCQALDTASRHGPPGLKIDVRYESPFARGRLDLRETLNLRRMGRPALVSVGSERSLDHAISRTLVSAERALNSQLSREEWRTQRVREVMPHLRAAVGVRPRLPNRHELNRIRYTPITLPFRRVVEISHRIAERRGFMASDDPGAADGLLIDVAELWELFVFNCAKHAWRGKLTVEHGSSTSKATHLLSSAHSRAAGIGRVIPDVLVRSGPASIAILDAKYKRLTFSPEHPTGVDRGDLYQLAAYLSRFGSDGGALGILAFPDDESEPAAAAVNGPWRNETGNLVHFLRLPVDAPDCTSALCALLPQERDLSYRPRGERDIGVRGR